MIDGEYTGNDIKILNFVQSVFLRPTVFTEDGICDEIYSLFIDFDIGTRDRTNTDRNIFRQTLGWMWSGVKDCCRTIAEFRDRYRDDATALAAIEQFATTQGAK